MVNKDITKITLREIFQAALESDKAAQELLKNAAERLGIKIAYLVNLLNPEIVIIGGGLEEAGQFFLDTIRQSVSRWTFEEMFDAVKIIYSALGENAVALGAASLSMRQLFAQI